MSEDGCRGLRRTSNDSFFTLFSLCSLPKYIHNFYLLWELSYLFSTRNSILMSSFRCLQREIHKSPLRRLCEFVWKSRLQGRMIFILDRTRFVRFRFLVCLKNILVANYCFLINIIHRCYFHCCPFDLKSFSKKSEKDLIHRKQISAWHQNLNYTIKLQWRMPLLSSVVISTFVDMIWYVATFHINRIHPSNMQPALFMF